ncbi:hypothetical protein D3C80_1296660 [compost metagenome]
MRVKAEVCRDVVAFTSGSGRSKYCPGWRMLAIIRPTASDKSDAVMNHNMALPKTRPTEPASPICAMPTTSVEKTNGPISILIRRKNTSETIEI